MWVANYTDADSHKAGTHVPDAGLRNSGHTGHILNLGSLAQMLNDGNRLLMLNHGSNSQDAES